MELPIPHNIKNILFIDIETVSCSADYENLPEILQKMWYKKAINLGKTTPEEIAASFAERAAIYAEFGQIIAIGLGYITIDNQGVPILRLRGMGDSNEKTLLEKFNSLLEEKFQSANLKLCAHNGKEFDFPYLCRRMLVNGIPVPKVLDLTGKKPWEVPHLDTMEMWKFGDRKNFTSLDMLAHLFNISSSKSVMDGSQVNHYYYVKKDLSNIVKYCTEDVKVLAQIFLKLNNFATIQESNIIFT